MAKLFLPFFVVSRFNEDFSWVEEYTDHYMIMNRGNPIHGNGKIKNVENIGGNQRDICQFAYDFYGAFPKAMAFIQANPFDHCRRDVFDSLIKHTYFTPIEYYGKTPANGFENRAEDGGFMELNNGWYIQAHNSTYGLTCRYQSFDEFMNYYFTNYQHRNWIRFAPGSQYIIEDRQFLKYPKNFWKRLMNELNSLRPTEGHIIERALYMILTENLELREHYE